MTTSTTTTSNKDYFNNNDFQDDGHILCSFSCFYCMLILETLIIQNMFGDICNENSISVKIKAIYSAVMNVIRIKRNVNLLTIHIKSRHSWQTAKRIFLSIKVY